MSNNEKLNKKESGRVKTFERYKILWEISEASPIIRRYFAMNFFDGVLTALGIVLSGFAFLVLNNPVNIPSPKFIFFSGLTTAIAIGISGLTGSHLAETTERKLNVLEMKHVLGLSPNHNDSVTPSERKWSEKDIRLALGKFETGIREKKRISTIPLSLHMGLTSDQAKKLGLNLDGSRNLDIKIPEEPTKHEKSKRKKSSIHPVQSRKKKISKKPEKTIYEEAQSFAGKIAAAVDGLSPFIGVLIVIIPFLFGINETQARFTQYIISFILSVIVLFLLGSYLANISRESKIKYGTQMVLAAVLTGLLTVGLGFLVQST
ncbi:MAG: VIT1/CCC1 transporter family protein [Promethearchaeota archaeon]